jgi:hypothetical protein
MILKARIKLLGIQFELKSLFLQPWSGISVGLTGKVDPQDNFLRGGFRVRSQH